MVFQRGSVKMTVVGHSFLRRDETYKTSLKASFEQEFATEAMHIWPSPSINIEKYSGLTLDSSNWNSIYAGINKHKSELVLVYVGDNDIYDKHWEFRFGKVGTRIGKILKECPSVRQVHWSLIYPRLNAECAGGLRCRCSYIQFRG